VDYLGIAARMPATTIRVRNVVIDRYAVMAFRQSLFPHLYSGVRGVLLRGVAPL
jgi:hypothetical protein